MVDHTKMSISKRNRDTPSGTRPVDVKPSQLSPEPTGYFGSTEEGRPLKKPVSSKKNNNLTTQVIDNHPGSDGVCKANVIATPVKVDEWVQVKDQKRPTVAKEKPVSQPVARKLKNDHRDRSFIFHNVKKSESPEPRTHFGHDRAAKLANT
ncbi:unnamed protein product [Schistosoma curassoni]|uniref:Organ specific protein n=1 Tax=Schistosoma curassoni TaxID=6186 RepID=A0A183JFJ6_9TREM|nr:unnamed protein product [Schistosoma curassoni]